MSNHTTIKTIRLVAGVISLALSAMINAGQVPSIKYAAGAAQIIITDLGLLPGGTLSSGLAINNQPVIVGLATDTTFEPAAAFLGRKYRSDHRLRGQLQSSEHCDPRAHERAAEKWPATEVYGDNVYQGIYWNSTGQAFVLPALAGVDPFYGALHTRAHGINNLGQLVGYG